MYILYISIIIALSLGVTGAMNARVGNGSLDRSLARMEQRAEITAFTAKTMRREYLSGRAALPNGAPGSRTRHAIAKATIDASLVAGIRPSSDVIFEVTTGGVISARIAGASAERDAFAKSVQAKMDLPSGSAQGVLLSVDMTNPIR